MTVLGVYGAGSMGSNHVRTARMLREWHDVVVFDVDASRADQVAGRHGFRAGAPSGDQVGAAIVAVPSDVHEQVTIPLLEQGVPVLLEKPVAHDLLTAQRILDAGRASGTPVVVGHVERFNSAAQELLTWASQAEHIEFRRVGPAGGRPLGDVVSDLMVHDLDLLLAVAAAKGGAGEVTSVQAQWGAGSHDMCSALLTTDTGLTATVVASRLGQSKNRQIVMTCPDAVVTADLVRQQVQIQRLTRMEFADERGRMLLRQSGTTEIPFLDNGEPLMREQRHFHAVVHGERPLVSLDEGVSAMRLVEQVRTAAG